MTTKRECPDCGTEYTDFFPGKIHKCKECGYEIPPRKNKDKAMREACKDNPRHVCVCCGAKGHKVVDVEGAKHLLCNLCHDFSPSYDTREAFMKYRASGGAAVWLMAGKRTVFDSTVDFSVITQIKERDVPKIPALRRRPGSFQGGVPFGFKEERGQITKDPEQVLTLALIKTYLERKQSLSSICRELVRANRPNKHGKVSWAPSQVRFLAEREGWM